MGVNVTINTSGLTTFAAALRELVATFPVEEEKALLAGAEVVSESAKGRCDSPTTRATIRTLPLPPINGHPAVAVGAGESGSGNPGLYPLLLEGGNGATKFSHWEHPVFGNDSVLVAQMSHPYLKPALDGATEGIEEALSVEIQEHIDEHLDKEFS